MAVSRLQGKPPSEVLGVGCPWCAYCLDEALLVREAIHNQSRQDQPSDPDPAAVEDHYRSTGRLRFSVN